MVGPDEAKALEELIAGISRGVIDTEPMALVTLLNSKSEFTTKKISYNVEQCLVGAVGITLGVWLGSLTKNVYAILIGGTVGGILAFKGMQIYINREFAAADAE